MGLDPLIKLKALPFQFVEIENVVVLKRGCVELKISGKRAAEIVSFVLRVTSDAGASIEAFCEAFPGIGRSAIIGLIEKMVASRFLVPVNCHFDNEKAN